MRMPITLRGAEKLREELRKLKAQLGTVVAPGFRARVRLPLHLTTRTADDPPAHADR